MPGTGYFSGEKIIGDLPGLPNWLMPETTKAATADSDGFLFVEIIGVEPMTSCMPCKRSSQLSYTPSFSQNATTVCR